MDFSFHKESYVTAINNIFSNNRYSVSFSQDNKTILICHSDNYNELKDLVINLLDIENYPIKARMIDNLDNTIVFTGKNIQ
jgi:hypothetical protein